MFLTPSLLVSLCLLRFYVPCHGQLRYNVNYPALRQTAYGYTPIYSYPPTYTPVGNYLPREENTWSGETRNVVQKAHPSYTSYEEYGTYSGPYDYKRTPSTQQTTTPVGYGVWQQAATPVKNAGRPETKWEFQRVDSSRICSPGPPLEVNRFFKNCLIIGDSISLGYLPAVKRALQGLCQVQHAPFAKASGAVDSNYGLKCLPMMLSTTSLGPTKYDAIVFNFGMHDIDFSRRFHEEYVPLPDYRENLQQLKKRLLDSGAELGFALTTPVPFDVAKNMKVQQYNQAARSVMEGEGNVDVIDLYSVVRKLCGNPPYRLCRFMKKPKDVHYNPQGSNILGRKIAEGFLRLLSRSTSRGRISWPNVPELYAREGLASYSVQNDSSLCPDMLTRCPSDTTCCESLMSLTGYGCCMFPQAVRCPDNWHCCPLGQSCSPECNFKNCRCIRLVPSQKQAIRTSKAFPIKGRKYHTAQAKGIRNNASMQKKFKSHEFHLRKESHKGGKLNNLRHRSKFRRKHWRKTAAKLDHGDSAKGEREKHKNKKKQKKYTKYTKKKEKMIKTKNGKSTFAMKATHRRYHSTAATKPHLSNITKTAEAHNETTKVSHHSKHARRPRKESKKKNAKLIASKMTSAKITSMSDELEHLIKIHRNQNVTPIRRPNINKRPPGSMSKHKGKKHDKMKEELDMKQPMLATIFYPARKKGVGKETKTLFPSKERLPNNVKHNVKLPEPNAQTPLRITANGESSVKGKPISSRKGKNGNKTSTMKRFSKKNRTKGRLRFKPKDVFQTVRQRPYKKSKYSTSAKGMLQTGSNGVLYTKKIHSSGRIPTGDLHTGPKTPYWNSAGSYAGEGDVSGEESEKKTRLRQPDRHGESSHAEASGIYSERSGSHQTLGKYRLGYHQGEEQIFGGESGDDLSYGHLEKERNNPISQNVGSGSEFGSNLWESSKTSKSSTQLGLHKGNILEPSSRKRIRLKFETGPHKAEWSVMGSYQLHSQGSGEGSGDKLAYTPKIPNINRPAPYEGTDISNSGSRSAKFQEPNGMYNKLSQVKNTDHTGEDSGTIIHNKRKQPEQNNLLPLGEEEGSSTEESTPMSGEVLKEQGDQDSMESRTGNLGISGEESAMDPLLFSLLSHESKTNTFGGGRGLISGEGVESNEQEVEVSGGESGMGYRTATKVRRTKRKNLSVKLNTLRERLKTGFSVSTNQLTMVKKNDGQNSNANIASTQLEKDYWLKNLQHDSGHSAELKSIQEIRNHSHHLKRKYKHLDFENFGLVAKSAQSQLIPPGVNIEDADQDNNAKESRHGISDGSGVSTNEHIYTKQAGKASRIHAQYAILVDRKDAKKRRPKAFGRGDYKDHKHEYHKGRSASRREKDQNLSLNTVGTYAKTSSRENHHDQTTSDYGSSGRLRIHSEPLQPPISTGILPDRFYLDQYFNDYDDYDGKREDLKTHDDLASSSDDEERDDDDEDDEDWNLDQEDETYL